MHRQKVDIEQHNSIIDFDLLPLWRLLPIFMFSLAFVTHIHVPPAASHYDAFCDIQEKTAVKTGFFFVQQYNVYTGIVKCIQMLIINTNIPLNKSHVRRHNLNFVRHLFHHVLFQHPLQGTISHYTGEFLSSHNLTVFFYTD